MAEACKELEDIKSAMEKLKADYLAKSKYSESLQRAHEEQLAKFQEAKMEIEKQAQELDGKTEEISLARKMYEDLKLNLHEKEDALKHLTSANDMLRTRSDEKLTVLNGVNGKLVCDLSEAKVKIEYYEQKIYAYMEEVEGLKGLLSESQKKCFDAERKAQTHKELKKGEEMLVKLEQEIGRAVEELKWKNEQFRHLEEAYRKVQDQFRGAGNEWESEKCTMVDELCSLQTNLESQNRLVEDLRLRLQMCNEALVHEESRRKLLEVQVHESKAIYEGVATEYEEARLKIENLTMMRDGEIATLRNLLATKDSQIKEIDFRKAYLEKENEELQESLKELQEAQIIEAGAHSSLKNIRQKLRSLEKAHKDCSANLKAREAELSSQSEKLETELHVCLSKVTCQDKQLQSLQAELEDNQELMLKIKLENEELYVLLMVVLEKLSDLNLELVKSKNEMKLHAARADERVALLTEQFEKKNSAFAQAQAEIMQVHETSKNLLARVDCSMPIQQQFFLVKKELDGHKQMLEESSMCLDRLKEQAYQKECALKEDLRKVLDDLHIANFALDKKSREAMEVEFQLQHCKSVSEQMRKSILDVETEKKSYFDELQCIKRKLDDSFLAKVELDKTHQREKEIFLKTIEERDMKIEHLKQHIVQLEGEFESKRVEAVAHAKMEIETSFLKEKESFVKVAEDRDSRLKSICTDFDLLEKELARTQIESAITLEQERASFLQVMKAREEVIFELQNQIRSLEQEFTSSVESAVTLELADMQFQNETLYDACENIVASHLLDVQEIEYKSIVITALEEEIFLLEQKLESEKQLFSVSEKCAKKVESELQRIKVESKREMARLDCHLKSLRSKESILECGAEELKSKIKTMQEIIARLSSEKQELADQMIGFAGMLNDIYGKEVQLRMTWKRVLQRALSVKDVEEGDLLIADNVQEGITSPLRNKAGLPSIRRSPLKEHNG